MSHVVELVGLYTGLTLVCAFNARRYWLEERPGYALIEGPMAVAFLFRLLVLAYTGG